MTTSMTPTHGDPVRHGSRTVADGDPERWLPDPSWPVPPRGWQLWAAAGSSARPGRAGNVRIDRSGDESEPHSRAAMDHTDDVKSDMPPLAVLEDASFTLPTRPSALLDDGRVDLLADLPARRVPEGALAGFAVLGALVLFSCLVGGLTGGLIVIGVSTLLAASAALVRGHLALSQVGGQRGAGLLLGAAVMALIVGSVASHDRRSTVEILPSATVPVSSDRVADTQTVYAAVPPSQSARPVATQAGSTPRPVRTTEVAAPARPAEASAPVGSVESVESAGPAEPVVPVADPTPAATSRADLPEAVSATGGVALTLSPDALSPVADTPGVAASPKPSKDAKSAKAGMAGKAGKASKAGKAGKASKAGKAGKAGTAKDAKAAQAKDAASAENGKAKGAKGGKGSAAADPASSPRLSDAGIGGSGAASTSVTGFSVTPGARADRARHPGVATIAAR